MQIQINTDHNVDGAEKLAQHFEAEVSAALDRFSGQITRVEVHFSDENGTKSGAADKRCLIEARPTGHQPLAASHDAATLQGAFDGAAKKVLHLLESTLGRLHDHRRGVATKTDMPIV